jgi:CTP synthase
MIEGQGVEKLLEGVDGILVPGGFGVRGTDGKIEAVHHARTQAIPFFGICLGLQMALVEFGRNVLGLAGANSIEFDPETKYPVVTLMENQRQVSAKGGTMRLGAYACTLQPGTLAHKLYKRDQISERHRHRYEFNNSFRAQYEEQGMIFSGMNTELDLVEMIELRSHPYFLGCQFHPEFKSRPLTPHPLFSGFVQAALVHRDARREVPSPLRPVALREVT